VLLGSWPALVVLALIAGAAMLVRRSWFALPAWLSGLLLIGAALSVARGRRALVFAHQNESLTQLLCIGALAAAVLAAASWVPRQDREP
jgi:hypothetical protein